MLLFIRLAEGGSVQDHIESLTEVCDELTVTGKAVNKENYVVYFLASLPESYNILINALVANAASYCTSIDRRTTTT